MEPHISWRRLGWKQLAEILNEKEVTGKEKRFNNALISLVMDGKVRAFLCPDGELRYQYNIAHEYGLEGTIQKLENAY